MRSSGLLGLAIVLALTGCDASAAVLVRHNAQDGSIATDSMVDATSMDATVDAAVDAVVVVDAGMDADTEFDASVPVAVEIHATGYGAFVGRTVYGRLGQFSANIVSTTVASDGTITFVFPPVILSILNNIYLDTYVDVDGNGDCDRNTDDAGGVLINLSQDGDGTFRDSYDRSDLNPPLFGCNGL